MNNQEKQQLEYKHCQSRINQKLGATYKLNNSITSTSSTTSDNKEN